MSDRPMIHNAKPQDKPKAGRHWIRRILIALPLLAVFLYGLLVLAFYFLQEDILFHSNPREVSPQAQGLSDEVQTVRLEFAPGQYQIAWEYLPKARQGPVILFFGGNAGTVGHHARRLWAFQKQGYGFLAVNHRGYGGSDGKPSEAALIGDGINAFDYLVSQGIPPRDIIVVGYSLGTGIAVPIAASRDTGGIVLFAPFTSIVEVAELRFPFLIFTRYLTKNRFDSLEIIDQLTEPLLIVHGDRDHVVPYQLGKKLFDSAKVPKTFHTVSGARHWVGHDAGSQQVLTAFVENWRARQKP